MKNAIFKVDINLYIYNHNKNRFYQITKYLLGELIMALLKRIKYVLTADKKEVAEQQTSNISARNKKIIQLLVLIGLCCIPIVAITGCSSGKTFACKTCGSSYTYTPFYASGVTNDATKIEYESCVCPNGCIGFGCNSSCCPTEVLYVRDILNPDKLWKPAVLFAIMIALAV